MSLLDHNYNPTVGSVGGKYKVADVDVTGASNGDVITYSSTSGEALWANPTGGSTVLTDSHIFVGDGANTAQDVAVSGDLTMANIGATTVVGIQGVQVFGPLTDYGANYVQIAGGISNTNGAISGTNSAYNESAFIIGSVKHVTTGGSPSETVTITNVDANSGIQATLNDNGTNNVTLVSADYSGANTVTVIFSADPGNDAVVTVTATRLTSYLD